MTSCGDDGIRQWNLDSGEQVKIGDDQTYVSNLDYHPTAGILASTNAGGEVHLLELDSRKTIRVMRTLYGERDFDF